MPVRKLILLVASIACAIAPAYLAAQTFGDPRGFFSNQQISETTVRPGLRYVRAEGTHLGRPQVTHVITIDLTNPDLKVKSFEGERLVSASAGQFYRRSVPSQMQQDNEALVTINTAFFDWRDTMTPYGLHVRDGLVLREPAAPRPSFAMTEGGIPMIHNFGWSGTAVHGGASRTLQGVNRNALGTHGLVLYQQPWDRSPGKDAALVGGREITEVLFERVGFETADQPNQPHILRGRVLAVRNNAASVPLSSGRFVLTAAGGARTFLQQMSLGAIVEVRAQITGLPAGVSSNEITEVASGWHRLIADGVLQTGSGSHWDGLHPRTAVGISGDRQEMLMVVVDGRAPGRAEGMSLTSLRNYLNHMGAYNALEFDGGGSSAMVANLGGNDEVLNTPSDGRERYVPSGLGVVAVREHPFFQNVRTTIGFDGAAISWETPEPAVSHAVYGTEGYDRSTPGNSRPSTRHTVWLGDLPQAMHFVRLVAETPEEIHTSRNLDVDIGFEVALDDSQAALAGTWSSGDHPTPYGPGYRWATTTTGSPTHTATFRPNLPVRGLYDVYTWHVPGGNRTTQARHEVRHGSGTAAVSVNQQAGGNGWGRIAANLLFNAGTEGYVRVRNDSPVGTVVMADGVRWVLRSTADREPGEVPEWWARHFFGENPPAADVDADGDSFTVSEEFLWGTIPNEASSRPHVEIETGSSAELQLAFSPFRNDRDYVLEASADLRSWAALDVSPREEDRAAVFEVPNEGDLPQRFYRIRVVLP